MGISNELKHLTEGGNTVAKSKNKWELAPGEESIQETRARIRQDAEPALVVELDWFQDFFDRETRDGIRRHWEFGQRYLRIYDDATKNRGNLYGVHAVEQIQ